MSHTHRLRSAPSGGDYRAHLVNYFKSQQHSNIQIARLLAGKEHRMKRTQGLNLQAAAREIGFNGGRGALKNFLAEQGCIYGNGIPNRALVQQGLLIADTRQHTVAGGPCKQYSVLLVTPAGLSWLQELAEKHGKTTQTLRRRNHGAAHTRRTAAGAGASASTPA